MNLNFDSKKTGVMKDFLFIVLVVPSDSLPSR